MVFRVIVSFFCIFISCFASAISIVVDRHVITPKNSGDFDVRVYKSFANTYCKDSMEVWVSAPKGANRAYFNLVDEKSNPLISGHLKIQEYVADPIMKRGATYTDGSTDELLKQWQDTLYFMARDFRGVLLCANDSILPKLTLYFDKRFPNGLVTDQWLIGSMVEMANVNE